MMPGTEDIFQDSRPLQCADCEEHLADLVDGTIAPGIRGRVLAHLKGCAGCAALAEDAGQAVALMQRTASVEVPAALIPRILAEMTTGPSRVLVEAPLAERILGRWIRPVLQPRFALGLAMAALSIAMIPRFWSLDFGRPDRIWMAAENRIYRTFDRAVKNYEDLALVADVQSQIDELSDAGGDPGARGDGERLR